MRKINQGFTIIELLVTATILAVLAAGAMTAYSSINMKSRDSRRLSDIEQLRSALEMYRADYGAYPIVNADVYEGGIPNSTLTADLVTKGYIQKLPREPKSTHEYYYSSSDGSVYQIEVCTETNQTNQACFATNVFCGSLSTYCTLNP